MARAATTTAAPRRAARSKGGQAQARTKAQAQARARPQAQARARPRTGTRARSRPRTAAATRGLRIRWERVGRVLLVVVLAVVAGLYVQQGLAYLSARSQADAQNAVAAHLARQNARLAREARSLNNPATIEKDARALGMVKPGERPYVLTHLPAG
jgi:cell division protein FtsB